MVTADGHDHVRAFFVFRIFNIHKI